MVLTRLYVDKKDSINQTFAQLQYERYKQATQPYYVISNMLAKTSIDDVCDACASNLSPAPKLIGFSITTVESAGTSTVFNMYFL